MALFPPGKGGGDGVAYGYKGCMCPHPQYYRCQRYASCSNYYSCQWWWAAASPDNASSNSISDPVNQATLSVALKLLLLTKDTMLDGCAEDSVLRVFDHRSKNGYAEAKSPRADQLRKLYLATNKSALSRGFNASIEDSLFGGNAWKYVLMLSFSLPVLTFGFRG